MCPHTHTPTVLTSHLWARAQSSVGLFWAEAKLPALDPRALGPGPFREHPRTGLLPAHDPSSHAILKFMEGSVPKVHLQVSLLDQAIHLPRETVSVDAINKVMVKSMDLENGTLQQIIEPLCFLIYKEEGHKNIHQVEKNRT